MKSYSRRELYALGEPIGEASTRLEAGRRIYGGGGGGGGSSTTIQSIPNELKPLATAYVDKAINLSNQPYQPYYGQRYADLNTTQNLGIGMIQNRALNGDPTFNNAQGNLNQMMSGGSNPYLDAMVNKAQMNVLGNANQAGVMSGSFGNSGINEAAAGKMADIATQMYGSAYDADQNRRMSAIGMAPTFANQAYNDASRLMQAGQMQQDQNQQNLDFNYQQFQDASNLPYKNLAAMSGVFGSGLGTQSTTTTSGGGK